jgi:hypothetical protein
LPRLALLAGLLLLGTGWVVQLGGWSDVESWLALGLGTGLILSGLWAIGRRFPRGSFRPPRWRGSDTLCLAGALLVLGVTLLPLPGLGSAALWYTPYPRLALPPVDWRVGLSLLGLLGPLAGARRGVSRSYNTRRYDP